MSVLRGLATSASGVSKHRNAVAPRLGKTQRLGDSIQAIDAAQGQNARTTPTAVTIAFPGSPSAGRATRSGPSAARHADERAPPVEDADGGVAELGEGVDLPLGVDHEAPTVPRPSAGSLVRCARCSASSAA